MILVHRGFPTIPTRRERSSSGRKLKTHISDLGVVREGVMGHSNGLIRIQAYGVRISGSPER